MILPPCRDVSFCSKPVSIMQLQELRERLLFPAHRIVKQLNVSASRLQITSPFLPRCSPFSNSLRLRESERFACHWDFRMAYSELRLEWRAF